MYELKKIGNVFTSKSVGTGPSSYEKSIYRAAVSQRLRNTGPEYPNRCHGGVNEDPHTLSFLEVRLLHSAVF